MWKDTKQFCDTCITYMQDFTPHQFCTPTRNDHRKGSQYHPRNGGDPGEDEDDEEGEGPEQGEEEQPHSDPQDPRPVLDLARRHT